MPARLRPGPHRQALESGQGHARGDAGVTAGSVTLDWGQRKASRDFASDELSDAGLGARAREAGSRDLRTRDPAEDSADDGATVDEADRTQSVPLLEGLEGRAAAPCQPFGSSHSRGDEQSAKLGPS